MSEQQLDQLFKHFVFTEDFGTGYKDIETVSPEDQPTMDIINNGIKSNRVMNYLFLWSDSTPSRFDESNVLVIASKHHYI